MSAATLSAINVYPIKGCRGIPLESAVITPTGLLFDRNWVVVRAATGKFVTQRQQPRLALVEVSITPEQLLQGAEISACPDAKLVLRAPGMEQLEVPLTATAAGKALSPVTVWDWSGQASDEGDAAAQWFTQYLGFPTRLLRYSGQAGGPGSPTADPQRRQVEPEWGLADGTSSEVAFADGFPYLLANEASLVELNLRLAEQGEAALPLNRFRPNFVVAGAGPYAEDSWKSLKIGGGGGGEGQGDGIPFEAVRPCSRCKVTTIDQASCEEGMEPLVTLGTTRSGRVLGWEDPPDFRGSVFFCWNLASKAQRGVVRVGDPLQVLEVREGPPLPTNPGPA